jgi:diguanylate cyclase (GGDEF)-like protein/PAS domain S-box-containing protein
MVDIAEPHSNPGSDRGTEAPRAAPRSFADAKRRLDDITRLVSDWVWETDAEFRFTFVSHRAIELFGMHPLELAGQKFGDLGSFVSPDGVVIDLKWRSPFRNVQFDTHGRDGKRKIFLVNGLPVHNPDTGVFEGMRGTAEDITERKTASDRLKQSEERYRTLYDKTPAMVHSIDRDGRLVSVSEHWLRSLGYSADDVIGRNIQDFMTEPSRHYAEKKVLPEFLRTGVLEEVPYQFVKSDGAVMDVLLSAIAERDADGAVVRSLAVVIDVTERKRAEERLRLAGMVFDATTEAIMVTDANNRIKAVNPAFTQITDYTSGDVAGKNPAILSSGRHDAAFYRSMWESLEGTGHWEGEIWNRRKNGEIYPAWLSIAVIRDESGKAVEYVALFSDITKRKQDEEHIRRRANTDALTGLPNRTAFLDRLSLAISGAQRQGGLVALLFIDLDGFKAVNDTFGHIAGDRVLIMAAERLRSCAREADTVARFGGDEFTVILPGIARAENAATVAEKVIGAFSAPFPCNHGEALIGASIGITVFPTDGDNAVTLLRNADLAMYRAKDGGPNVYKFFTSQMDARALQRLRLEGDLRRALGEDALEVHYQPVIDLRSGHVTGAEALLRWNHPTRGIVLPEEFVPLAEETGLIVPIGAWVLRTASRQTMVWRKAGMADFVLGVNLSTRQLQPGFSPQAVAQVLEETGLAPEHLTFEITENLVMGDTPEGIAWLHGIKDLGVRLSIDDFGTGYSSVTSLKRLPIDVVKIDRSFIGNATNNQEGASLVKTVIAMVHSLGLKVVAEGVETAEQLEFLTSHKCDYGQGYFLGAPMPCEDFVGFVREFSMPYV